MKHPGQQQCTHERYEIRTEWMWDHGGAEVTRLSLSLRQVLERYTHDEIMAMVAGMTVERRSSQLAANVSHRIIASSSQPTLFPV